MVRKIIALLLVIMLFCGNALAAYVELSNGSRDGIGEWNVYSLQLKLHELGYIEGQPDGHFGNGTEAAVKSFQADHGLEATGIADVDTQELLFSIDPEAEATDVEDAVSVEDQQVSLGEDDVSDSEEKKEENEVYIVQHNLSIWGFLPYKPDGLYGANTRAGMKLFQEYTYDDMLVYTQEKLIDKYSLQTPEPTAEPTPVPEDETSGYDMAVIDDTPISAIPCDGTITGYDHIIGEVEEGSRGMDVQRMQNRLMSLGYMAGGNDGVFGEQSKVALKYFQQLNGLEETGRLDAETEAVLFSGNAVESDKYVAMYKLMVSVTDQRVYVYRWTGSDYTALVHTFICSSGAVDTPTILGTFQAPGRNGEWYWMEESNVWVKYAFVIDGGYFFHSVLFPDKDGEPTATSVRNLGTRASHGCIRLSVEDAEWIYNNCSSGTTVVIYDDAQ